jgi:DGQHR domain-containing protein
MYMFDGPEDELKALNWMLPKLIDQYIKAKGLLKEEIYSLIQEIKSRIDYLKDDPSSSQDDLHDNLWDRFIYCISGKWADDQDASWQPPYELGEWNFVTAHSLDIGHSNFLIKTEVPKGGGSAKHYYSQKPEKIVWKLTPITQKGYTFYIGKAKVSEVDAACSVPQLPAELDSAETAMRVLNKKRGEQEWQRRVVPKRIMSIANFIKSPHNIIANSAILYCPEHPGVTTNPDGTIEIDFSFLYSSSDGYTDHKGAIDLRPIWLIDGQHRTRGLAQSEDGIELEIPIIFFSPEFNLSQSAKIFAEINTLQQKLSALHTLFMQHRFQIPSPTAKRDFTAGWENGDPALRHSRANHLAYECAAYLASNEGGPLYNRVKILDQNSSQFSIMQASQWLDFSRSWFGEGNIYGPDCPETQDEINKEVENYFTAFVNTCNHDEWADKKHRWCLKSSPKGLVQRTGPSQVLLKIYPTVWMKAKDLNPNHSPIPVETFEEVLKPLKYVDWLDPRLKPYARSGEPPRTALRIWMQTAIVGGECYPLDEVMNDKLKSKPGRGILAPPANCKISSVDDKKWPYAGKPVVLRAKRPDHSWPTSSWMWEDNEGVNRTPQTSETIQVRGDTAEVTIRYASWMKDVNKLTIRVDWRNPFGNPGFGKIVLEK